MRAFRARRPLSAWSLLPSSVGGLTLVPVDLEPADRGFIDELASGHLGLDGIEVEIGRGSPFAVERPPERWQAALHGFRWLGHMRAASGTAAAETARDLVADWLSRHSGSVTGIAWRPDVVARRLGAWLCNAHLVLDGAEAGFYARVLSSLGAQARYLDGVRHRLPDGRGRIDCLVALLQTALVVAAAERHVARLEGELTAELGRQVLPDGAHVDRNPGTVLDLLLALLPLRQCLLARERAVPAAMAEPIARMLAFLRHMRLGDGALARMHGMGATRTDLLSTVLSFAGAAPADHVPGAIRGGYARLARGSTVLIVDAGSAPPRAHAGAAQAGCLSFEMSYGGEALLRNCGAPKLGSAEDRFTARATASHNTLSLEARSSARLLEAARGDGPAERVLSGPTRVSAKLEPSAAGGIGLLTSHDGWLASHGIVHTRRLELSDDGLQLTGSDALGPASGVLRLAYDVPFAIRFHLAAGVEAQAAGDGRSAALLLPDGARWQLTVGPGVQVAIEASVDFAHVTGRRPGRQIVLRGATPGETTIEWLLARVPAPTAAGGSDGADGAASSGPALEA